MALARCECGQVFDIPGLYRSYKQIDGRCAKCNGVTGEPTVDMPSQVVAAFKIEKSVPIPEEQFKVETGIPLQPKVAKKGHPRKGVSIYPFAQMRPPRPNGDMVSFFVRDDKTKTDKQNRQRIASAIFGYKRSHPQFKGEFKYRHVGDGIRVWRVK